jgi:type I restriction enzyme S subunit
VAVSNHRGIVSGDYLVCAVTGDVHGAYLHYVLRSRRLIEEYIRRSTGIRPQQWRLYWDDFADIAVDLPRIDGQRRIADFLDAETARIDALIAAKQQMVRVGTARMKSFVVSTLDGAPRHPLKRQASLIDCKHRTPTYTPDGYPVVSPGDVTAGVLDLSRCHRFVDEADWADLAEGPRRPRAGDIVYSRNASVGLAALVRDGQQFCMGQDVCLVRTTRPDGDGRCLTHVLNTVGLDQIDAMKVGSTFFRVNVAQIAELQVPAVSIAEQDDLVRRWDAERERLDGLADTLTAQIALLRERRQALITAAVTGEIEV